MIKQIEYSSEKTDNEVLGYIERYFVKQGFTLEKRGEKELRFSRGSKLLNMFTFNPLKWKNIVKAEFKEQVVRVAVYIDTSFQSVLDSEEEVWDLFLRNLQESTESGVIPNADNESLIREGKGQSYRYLGYGLLGAVIFGGLGGIITFLLDIETDVLIRWGGIGGGLALMAYKSGRKKGN